MTYDSIRKELMAEKKSSLIFSTKAKLFLKSSNMHEYVIERDVKMPRACSRIWWLDEFIIYWAFKEHFKKVLFGFFAVCSAIQLGIAFACTILNTTRGACAIGCVLVALIFSCLWVLALLIHRQVSKTRLREIGIDEYYRVPSLNIKGGPFYAFGELDDALSLAHAHKEIDDINVDL